MQMCPACESGYHSQCQITLNDGTLCDCAVLHHQVLASEFSEFGEAKLACPERFDGNPCERRGDHTDHAAVRMTGERVYWQTCAGCLLPVRSGFPGDHAKGCPTGQNGSPKFD